MLSRSLNMILIAAAGVIGISLNLLFIFIAVRYTRTSIGSYKYLMIVFALYQCFYSILEIVVEPWPATHGYGFVLAAAGFIPLSETVGSWLMSLYVGTFCCNMALLSVHFIYRWLALTRPRALKLFSWPRSPIWAVYVITLGTIWGAASYAIASPNKNKTKFMTPLLKMVANDSSSVGYLGLIYFWNVDSHLVPSWPDFGLVGIAVVIMTLCYSISLFCGYHTYSLLRKTSNLSSKSRSIQMQLFKALSVQTIVPTFVVYSPVFYLIVTPMFGFNFDMSFVSVCFILFPLPDSLSNLYFVRDYRRVIFGAVNIIVPTSVAPSTKYGASVHRSSIAPGSSGGAGN